jgi:hypothetical protein
MIAMNLLLLLVAACAPTEPSRDAGKRQPSLGYPAAAKRPVVNSYHGVSVSDDYQWLEDVEKFPAQAILLRNPGLGFSAIGVRTSHGERTRSVSAHAEGDAWASIRPGDTPAENPSGKAHTEETSIPGSTLILCSSTRMFAFGRMLNEKDEDDSLRTKHSSPSSKFRRASPNTPCHPLAPHPSSPAALPR